MSQPSDPCGCEPCVPWAMCAGCCPEWSTFDVEVQCRAEALAWSTLRTLSGGRVGNCAVVMRPCLSPPCDVCSADVWMRPHVRDGHWINSVCPTPRCSCQRMCEIVLPGPVAVVSNVSWSGEDLPLSSFRLDNGNVLVRQDGECWPSCQRLDLPLGSPCTLGVTYVPGLVPGATGEWAAGVLACEYAKACTGGRCRLPSSVTTIARQGVSMELSTGMFSDGFTGIREVDAYLVSINPYQLRTPPRVWSPDIDVALHRYTTPVAPATLRPSSQQVRFSWIEADPVERTVVVHDGVTKGWLGDYRAQLRAGPDSAAALVGEFAVTAEADGPDVVLTFVIDAAASADILAGQYWWDAQQIGSTTRLHGTASVGAQVTVVP